MIPGEYFIQKGYIECNVGRKTVTIVAVNTGDRPIQIGSHYHFFETNPMMSFDRAKAFNMRLNIAAGTATRFEPGEEKEVMLVEIGGANRIYGFNNLVDGDTSMPSSLERSMEKLEAGNFKNVKS